MEYLDTIEKVVTIVAAILALIYGLFQFVNNNFRKDVKYIQRRQFIDVTLPLVKIINKHPKYDKETSEELIKEFIYIQKLHYEYIPPAFLKRMNEFCLYKNMSFEKDSKEEKRNNKMIRKTYSFLTCSILYHHNELARNLKYPSVKPYNLWFELDWKYSCSRLFNCILKTYRILCISFALLCLFLGCISVLNFFISNASLTQTDKQMFLFFLIFLFLSFTTKILKITYL